MLPHLPENMKISAGTNSKNRSTCCEIATAPFHGAYWLQEDGQQGLSDRVDKREGDVLQGVLPEADHARRTCRW